MKLLLQSKVFALVACAGLWGCASGPCEEALDKLIGECGLGAGAAIPSNGGGGVAECKDETECAAECVIEADCGDITSSDQSDYSDCIQDCYAP